MFSHDPLHPASANPSTRNPRRRQRTHSDENSVIQPKAKKRRNVLTHDTFVKPPNGDAHLNGGPAINGSAVKAPNVALSEVKELTVRETRKGSQRGIKGDGSVVLVSIWIYKPP